MLGLESFAAQLPIDETAPEPAYIATNFGTLTRSARVADLLSQLLLAAGAANAGTVRNLTSRVGPTVAKPAAMSPMRYEHALQTAFDLAARAVDAYSQVGNIGDRRGLEE